jgi:hypothetical protein
MSSQAKDFLRRTAADIFFPRDNAFSLNQEFPPFIRSIAKSHGATSGSETSLYQHSQLLAFLCRLADRPQAGPGSCWQEPLRGRFRGSVIGRMTGIYTYRFFPFLSNTFFSAISVGKTEPMKGMSWQPQRIPPIVPT